MVIQMIPSYFRQFIKILCNLQKYQYFINYVNHENVKILKYVKVICMTRMFKFSDKLIFSLLISI